MSPAEITTLAIALVGAGLGILNYVHQRNETKVRIKVSPARASGLGGLDGFEGIAIKVTNMGTFQVTISELGFTIKRSKKKLVAHRPMFPDSSRIPFRLEPRSSLTAYVKTPKHPEFCFVKAAYATTQCGETTTGTSPSLKGLVNAAQG